MQNRAESTIDYYTQAILWPTYRNSQNRGLSTKSTQYSELSIQYTQSSIFNCVKRLKQCVEHYSVSLEFVLIVLSRNIYITDALHQADVMSILK